MRRFSRIFHVMISLSVLLAGVFMVTNAMGSSPFGVLQAEDGRSFRITTPGLADFHATWSATLAQ